MENMTRIQRKRVDYPVDLVLCFATSSAVKTGSPSFHLPTSSASPFSAQTMRSGSTLGHSLFFAELSSALHPVRTFFGIGLGETGEKHRGEQQTNRARQEPCCDSNQQHT